jgi:hypothetical protein
MASNRMSPGFKNLYLPERLLDFSRFPPHAGLADVSIFRDASIRRLLLMVPIISALLSFVASLFRSRASLCLEHLALRHQLVVYKQTVYRPRLRWTDRVF